MEPSHDDPHSIDERRLTAKSPFSLTESGLRQGATALIVNLDAFNFLGYAWPGVVGEVFPSRPGAARPLFGFS